MNQLLLLRLEVKKYNFIKGTGKTVQEAEQDAADKFLIEIQKDLMKKKLVQTIKLCIAGETNVGKSTFLNNIFKQKISIVSRKAQTTLKKKTGIFYFKDKQYIFLDTPGIFSTHARLSRSTFKQASNAILESDLVLLLLDATSINFENILEIIKYIQSLDKEYLIVVNKIDLLKKDEYLKKIENIQNRLNTKKILTISAIKAIGIKSLLQYIEKNFTFFISSLQKLKVEISAQSLLKRLLGKKY